MMFLPVGCDQNAEMGLVWKVVELLSQVLEHLVTGEFMQLSTDSQEVARLVCLDFSGFVLVLYYHSPIQLSCLAAWIAISLHNVLR
jgi:geranylgeranyl pyrophosphate synthase